MRAFHKLQENLERQPPRPVSSLSDVSLSVRHQSEHNNTRDEISEHSMPGRAHLSVSGHHIAASPFC